MINLNDIEKQIKWNEYYQPDFAWNIFTTYKNKVYSDEFIEEFKDKINWLYLITYQKFDEQKLRQYIDPYFFRYRSIWSALSIHQTLSETFIDEFKDKLSWLDICCYQKLSEPFIKTHADYVDWTEISIHQILSESFIEEFQDKVDWYYIDMYQKFSDSFFNKFKEKINEFAKISK